MKKFTLLSLLFLTLSACRKDVEEQVTTPETPNPNTVVSDYDPVIINFESSNGGTLSSAEGIALSFPANSIIDADGNTYDGTVNVDARWINPTADNLEGITR